MTDYIYIYIYTKLRPYSFIMSKIKSFESSMK